MQSSPISLIVSTYNNPEFLRLVLQSLNNQSTGDFEILIADDGSDDRTRHFIEKWAANTIVPMRHIWHEDNGFRKSAILNQAIIQATHPYVVFIDGDCVPSMHFIRDHRHLAKKHRVVGCSRIMLDQTITQHLLDNDLHPDRWSIFKWIGLRLSGHINRVFPFFRIPLVGVRDLTPKNWRKIRGCNFGAWKDDLLAVGGFDESFSGWGFEDSELAVRLIHQGCRVRRGDHAALVLHLWHVEVPRDAADNNQDRLDETISTGRHQAIQGINQNAVD